MAYRQTEKVKASMEARHASIIASAIDVISKSGMDGMLMETVAARADVSVGLIYKYFADGIELKAAVSARLLERDLAAIREAFGRGGRDGLGRVIALLAKSTAQNYRLMSGVGASEVYRAGISAELARMIRAAGGDGSPAILCAVAYGAIFEAARSLRPRDEPTLVQSLLRALGVTANRRAMA